MIKLDPFDLRDIAYKEAEKAKKRHPHKPLAMLSMDSTGPLKSWYCPVCSRFGTPIMHRTLTLSPPVCYGGYRFRR